jgi:hypothetical protein
MAAKKKYGRKAEEKVGKVMHEWKHGELRSGGSGRKVKDRKQAIAIGLSEARQAGAKVPPAPKKTTRRKRATGS